MRTFAARVAKAIVATLAFVGLRSILLERNARKYGDTALPRAARGGV